MDKTQLNAARRHLEKSDRVMARLIRQCAPLSPVRVNRPHFHALVRAIINQQLSVKAGKTIEQRVLAKQGGRYFTAERLDKISVADLRHCGMSQNKIRYARNLARAVLEGELNFRKLTRLDDEQIRQSLTRFPGIGPWSADMFLITSLRRPDVFPIEDLVLRKSMQRHYRLAENVIRDSYIKIAEAWRPYRTLACYYLWNAPA